MQSSDGNLLVAVNHLIAIAWSRYTHLELILTASRLPKGLYLRLLNASVISTLLCGSESWKLTA